jgi:Holliday junction DNA helicase RuvA
LVIAALTGTTLEASTGRLILDVNGVGYLVYVTTDLSAKVVHGDQISLRTAMVVREDALLLFGFETSEEQRVFELLCSVSGVGPKSALAIMSAADIAQIAQAVATEQDSVFKAVSGIGPKTAKLIVVSLAGKMFSPSAGASASSSAKPSNAQNQIVSALVSLGYQERAAAQAVHDAIEAAAADAPDFAVDSLLRAALAVLAQNRSSR